MDAENLLKQAEPIEPPEVIDPNLQEVADALGVNIKGLKPAVWLPIILKKMMQRLLRLETGGLIK